MGKRKQSSNKKIGIKVLIISIILIIIAAGVVLGVMLAKNKANKQDDQNTDFLLDPGEAKEEEIKIFNGNSRTIAVMIDNHNAAWPQAGIDKAYIVYEIIVEGGETRLMALFKGVDVANIGPVRSSRHYFLDYALENDAIYVHYGWSPKAESDIKSLKVNNINGITESTKDFWRTNKKTSPHDVLISSKSIWEIAEKKGYRLTSNKRLLDYSVAAVDLGETAQVAEKVTIPFSNLQTVVFDYDATNGVYKRSARGKVQTEMDSGKQIIAKNIIISFVPNSTLNDGENKGRQTLNNIGTFDGYYITEGKAIPIKCTKTSRESATEYKDLEGNTIKVNDGNTYINIVPKDSKVTIK